MRKLIALCAVALVACTSLGALDELERDQELDAYTGCEDGETRPRGRCGPGDTGTLVQECNDGVWSSTNSCEGAAFCVEGEPGPSELCPLTGAPRETVCRNDDYEPVGVCPEPCAYWLAEQGFPECGDYMGVVCGECTGNDLCVEWRCVTPEGYRDSATNLWWRPGGQGSLSEGMTACAGLSGPVTYRVPTLDELRTLVRGCPPAEPGGCDLESYDIQTCSCLAGEGDGEAGCYLDPGTGGECSMFWSQTALDTDSAWLLDFTLAAFQTRDTDATWDILCVGDAP